MRLVILTGMSGAGKHTAFKILEDFGYYCVDNLPGELFKEFIRLEKRQRPNDDVALGIDVRTGETVPEILEFLSELEDDISMEILFLEAEDEILIQRYKETRRNHPLSGRERIQAGIDRERHTMEPLRQRADYIIDTSHLLVRELRGQMQRIFVDNGEFDSLFVTILSFGFKYGIPKDADLVFDVRFLPNPYYVEKLRPLTGEDRRIRQFVLQNGEGYRFLDMLEKMLLFLIPHYVDEGKNRLVICFGCTGGRHRSVTIANEIHDRLAASNGFGLRIEHRDMKKR